MLPASVRCALYMIVAFALRRGKLGRELLRGTPSQVHNFPHDDRHLSPSALLRGFADRPGFPSSILKDKQGLPYPCCI
ncbi:MAG: hypothetical protein QOH93_2157 [Chloroflexia bacterium]|jgi:hypothetical protein|nr:hypothetical protein [Chloroflexia bacterium]